MGLDKHAYISTFPLSGRGHGDGGFEMERGKEAGHLEGGRLLYLGGELEGSTGLPLLDLGVGDARLGAAYEKVWVKLGGELGVGGVGLPVSGSVDKGFQCD